MEESVKKRILPKNPGGEKSANCTNEEGNTIWQSGRVEKEKHVEKNKRRTRLKKKKNIFEYFFVF